jgi:hypothetical protein
MEAIPSSETSVHTRYTRRHAPEDGILHSYRRENLKSYKFPLLVAECTKVKLFVVAKVKSVKGKRKIQIKTILCGEDP